MKIIEGRRSCDQVPLKKSDGQIVQDIENFVFVRFPNEANKGSFVVCVYTVLKLYYFIHFFLLRNLTGYIPKS
jgi:hypothetical protein